MFIYQTPLHIAAKFGYFEIIEDLLQCSRIEPNAKNRNGQTPLHFAAVFAQIRALQVLLDDQRIDINAQDNLNQTPLFVAVMEDNQEIIRELLSRKASLAVSDIDGNSPLHIAIELHRIGCELLIVDNVKNNNQERYFPELNCCDQNGMTPIQLAAQIGDLESILILRDYADLTHQDHQGICFFSY